jgi:mono/diheme cytochrome c family protein
MMLRSLKAATLVGFLCLSGTTVLIDGRRVSALGEPEIDKPAAAQNNCPDATDPALPLPSSFLPAGMTEFEKRLLQFLEQSGYAKWCRDTRVRDTGPYIENTYYGTHPAVRIYYSPKMMNWLGGDRSVSIPDGAMIIKEQYSPPAARYQDLSEAELAKEFAKSMDWTIMIKDSAGSKDGWYWGEFYPGMSFDRVSYPFNYPSAGYGQYCLRCHASADKELTFSSLNNINGESLTFRVDNSWRDLAPGEKPFVYQHRRPSRVVKAKAPEDTNSEFLESFKSILRVPFNEVQPLPPETLDRVFATSKGPEQFLSSDQCMMCHSAATGPYGPLMFVQTAPPVNGVPSGVNVSPYGEWRWSPMGLAGRDPIFYAQLESEIAIIKGEFKDPEPLISALVNTCLSCHGGMGKRQFDIDRKDPQADFKLDYVKLTDPNNPNFKYGSLARDGISCTMCHHIAEDQYPPGRAPIEYFLENSTTGQFQMSKPDELFGPFEDNTIATLPMENALGIKPRYNPYIKSSRLCGSCHTINLPSIDNPLKPGEKLSALDRAEKNPLLKPFKHSIEQATYLEWLNSQFQTEFNPTSNAQSCQDCHMPGGYQNADKKINIKQLQQPIAVVEDATYPAAEYRAPFNKINVRVREKGYARHELLGLNVFLLEMFNQFNDILGVRKDDYMSGSKTGLSDTIDNAVRQAREKTATIEIRSLKVDNDRLTAEVKVANLTGHRFPSGVGFRRAFIEFLVIESRNGREHVVWSSGRTNGVGVIVDSDGKTLPSEFFTEYRDGRQVRQRFQPHFEKITAPDQVQIYEELVQDAKGRFTTSFMHRDRDIKDNRLLPKGWSKKGPDPSIPFDFLEATFPKGGAEEDTQYLDGSGTDVIVYEVLLPRGVDPANVTVQATLYYQSIPPSYLDMRFKTAPQGEATRRLYYLASNLDLEGTPIAGWKLRLVSNRAQVKK